MTPDEFKIQVLPLKNKLFRLALRILGTVEEAEDTVQDAMMKLWVRKDELKKYNSIEAFAMVVTKNISLDRFRSKDFQAGRLADSHDAMAGPDPGEILEKSDMGRLVRRVMENLPEQQKAILHLRDIEGYEYEQIAEVMDMNVNAIRVNLSRARQKIRETIQKIQEYELARN